MKNRKPSRRDVIKSAAIMVGGATSLVVLPREWTKPVIESVVAPAQAFSYPPCFVNPSLPQCQTGGGGGGDGGF